MNEHQIKLLQKIEQLAKITAEISELWDDSDYDTYERLHIEYPYQTDLTELKLKTTKWHETQKNVINGIDILV